MSFITIADTAFRSESIREFKVHRYPDFNGEPSIWRPTLNVTFTDGKTRTFEFRERDGADLEYARLLNEGKEKKEQKEQKELKDRMVHILWPAQYGKVVPGTYAVTNGSAARTEEAAQGEVITVHGSVTGAAKIANKHDYHIARDTVVAIAHENEATLIIRRDMPPILLVGTTKEQHAEWVARLQ